MGTLVQGQTSFTLSDTHLFHLDVLLAECHKERVSFQFHFTLGGEDDYDLVSISLGFGCAAALKYSNVERPLNLELIHVATEKARRSGMLTMTDLIAE